ncbi:putative serine esterase-domain-containing protein [Sphaerosporella brunnea]|uniref:Putative serine esterase-domain-containing protein n=1 Tax=Sphaerosporella brunnea TaxID=1250544 RepID=A0A5J5F384_9PEZI|nr:putative serine esterase-domain-containing protein [Sphaerosporella brunnea]
MLLLHSTGSTTIGQVKRYTITYTPSSDRLLPLPTALHLRIKNTASLPLRAAYLHGPYTLYVSVRRQEFQPWASGTPASSEEEEEEEQEQQEQEEEEEEVGIPTYDPHLKAGASFYAVLPIPPRLLSDAMRSPSEAKGHRRGYEHGGKMSLDGKRSFFEEDRKRKRSVTWVVEIVSQVIFSTTATVGYEILLGRDEKCLSFGYPFGNGNVKPGVHEERGEDGVLSRAVTVKVQGTKELWNTPPLPSWQDALTREEAKRKAKKVHLVILTHGLHSNTGADMLFLKEAIDEEERKAARLRKKMVKEGKMTPEEEEDAEQVIVRGFHDNCCRTERGIKYLGKRLARFPEDEVQPYKITSISFIGHSLGGLVQTYAIAYIHAHSPNFFKEIKPVNFVTLATPFLGLSNENPLYVRFALDFGLVGKTGQDLGLTWRAPSAFAALSGKASAKSSSGDHSSKPLLRILPTGPAHEVLQMFRNRTAYANVVNDGIVPLRTSCLLFLDWKGLGRVEKARRENGTVGGLMEWANSALLERENPVVEAPHTGQPTAREQSQGQTLFPPASPAPDTTSPNPFSSLMTLLPPSDEPTLLEAPPRTSILEAAGDVLNPPLPTAEFIISPSSRPQTIFHDRVYHADDIPPLRRSQSHQHSSIPVEEKIARAYHKDMSWRKVLVRLEPDAHNNMVVRRMFANAYGWPVVQHLVETHFGMSFEALTADDEERGIENAPTPPPGTQQLGTDQQNHAAEQASNPHPNPNPNPSQTHRRKRSATIGTTSSAAWTSDAFDLSDDGDSDSSDDDDEETADEQLESFLGLPPQVRERQLERASVEVSRISAESARPALGTVGLGLRNLSFGSGGAAGGWGERRDQSTGERSEAVRMLQRCSSASKAKRPEAEAREAAGAEEEERQGEGEGLLRRRSG